MIDADNIFNQLMFCNIFGYQFIFRTLICLVTMITQHRPLLDPDVSM